MRDPYKTLGVGKEASDEEIKKAYRTLARQYHPDRNAGDGRPRSASRTSRRRYAILSDPEKRARVRRGRRFGPAASTRAPSARPASAAGFGGISDILSDLFGAAAAPAGAGRAAARRERGRDLETEVHISFDQAM